MYFDFASSSQIINQKWNKMEQNIKIDPSKHSTMYEVIFSIWHVEGYQSLRDVYSELLLQGLQNEQIYPDYFGQNSWIKIQEVPCRKSKQSICCSLIAF